MKHLLVRLYALVVVVFVSSIIGIFIFNIIGDMNKEIENARVAFESLEKAILNEVQASQLEDMTARQRLRRIANTLEIKGFVVQLAPSKGAVFSYPPDSSLFAIVNGNVLVKEESKFLKIFRTQNCVKMGEENLLIHITMIRSILPVQMIFLRSRTVFFLMLFIVLLTCSVFIYLKLKEGDKVERVYTDFDSSTRVKRSTPVVKRNRQRYDLDGDLKNDDEDERYKNARNKVQREQTQKVRFNQANTNTSSVSSNLPSSTLAEEPAYNRFQNSFMNSTNTADFSSSLNSGNYISSNLSSLEPLAFHPVASPSDTTPYFREDGSSTTMNDTQIGDGGFFDVEDYQTEHNSNNSQAEDIKNEDTSNPFGLYSPKTGLGWKAYVHERLESELGKASVIDQDVSFILIKILDVDNASLDQRRLADILVEVFRFKDMVFEYSDDEALGFAAILQDAYVDEAVRVCNGLFSKLQHEIFLTGQEPTIKMGITTRACRLTSASVIITEAKKALYNAIQNETEAIVGYQPSAEKYSQHSIENDR